MDHAFCQTPPFHRDGGRSFQQPRNRGGKSFVRSACGSLLELPRDETLCVIHHSLTDFLKDQMRKTTEQYPIIEPGPTHQRLALMCLAYLQNGCLGDVPLPSTSYRRPFAPPPPEPVLAPFTRYAAFKWHIHVQRACASGVNQAEMYTMLDKFTSHGHFPNWVRLVGLAADLPGTATPLIMSISLDLPGYLQHLLGKADIDPDQGSPIVLGADKGSVETVELLLRSSADVNQFDAQGYTALHRACVKNHFEVVRALLREGGDMNTLTRIVPFDVGFPPTQRSAVWYACHHGHETTVSELQVCMKSPEYIETALAIVVEYRRAVLVRNLLKSPLVDFRQRPAKVGSTEMTGSSSSWSSDDSEAGNGRDRLLSLACSNRDLEIIKLLVEAGADVNRGALHDLASSKVVIDHDQVKRCFSLLIEAGADVNLEVCR